MLQQFAIYSVVSWKLAFSHTNYSKADDIMIVYLLKNSTTWEMAAETRYNSEPNHSRMGCKPIYLWAISLMQVLMLPLMLGVNEQYQNITFNSERYG